METSQHTEAITQRDEARRRFEHPTTAKARRDADEDLSFWIGKVTALRHAEEAAREMTTGRCPR
jgi:hypothetical protein